MAKKSEKDGKKVRVPGRQRKNVSRKVSNGNSSFSAITLQWDGKSRGLNIANTNLRQAAVQWFYAVRNRLRWSGGAAAQSQERSAVELMNQLGIDDTLLADIARAGVVEVSMSWGKDEAENWPARLLPWEYLITAATRRYRPDRPLSVVRHLKVGHDEAPRRPIQSVLFVKSEPGLIRGQYSFDSEREICRTRLKAKRWIELDTPTAQELQNKILELKPDVIHLAGFDSHQALVLLGEKARLAPLTVTESVPEVASGRPQRDGFVLRADKEMDAGSDTRPDIEGLDFVSAERLSLILTGGEKHKPRLVSFNIRNSATRIAPQTVAHGALAAIGFQDLFDDSLAELFYSAFYQELTQSGWDLTKAFQTAWERIRLQPARVTMGSGVVLWSCSNLLSTAVATRAAPVVQRVLLAEDVASKDVRDWIKVETEATSDLNYSLLHNKRSLFRRFRILCPQREACILSGVRVRVTLSAGNEAAVFERLLDVTSPHTELTDISVPLTSAVTRSVHESLRTSILVEVSWGAHDVYRETHSARLMPVDQWRDSDEDRQWLPSFVFPRDREVTRLVDIAQRYVRVIRDDPIAGFEGYQSIDPKAADPYLHVDLQVRAIWSAILHELRLGYINPPPAYSATLDSQRLRTPSMIVQGHSGTCIDLALFFAACLELVDIYPVIFLLNDHAFPGYWRSNAAHDKFREARPTQVQEIIKATEKESTVSGAQRESWYLGKSTYSEIVQLVNAHQLVPLETVRLTENGGFAEGMEGGRENLRVKRDFAGMIDMVIAREENVTPLPILGAE